jgi:hypothetical protein
MPNARLPAPEAYQLVSLRSSTLNGTNWPRTDGALSGVYKTPLQIPKLNNRLPSVTPNDATRILEALGVVGERDEVVKGLHRAPRGEVNVRRLAARQGPVRVVVGYREVRHDIRAAEEGSGGSRTAKQQYGLWGKV